jgi:hypothetical protein
LSEALSEKSQLTPKTLSRGKGGDVEFAGEDGENGRERTPLRGEVVNIY